MSCIFREFRGWPCLQVGLIEISPYDQQPKIKIYREGDESSECKGDGSLCYNSEESVKLAIEILDSGFIRPAFQIRVTRADFSNVVPATNRRPALSQAQVCRMTFYLVLLSVTISCRQVKVARSAMKQALAWNEDDDIGVKKAAALKIVVLEGMFSPTDFESHPSFEEELQVRYIDWPVLDSSLSLFRLNCPSISSRWT